MDEIIPPASPLPGDGLRSPGYGLRKLQGIPLKNDSEVIITPMKYVLRPFFSYTEKNGFQYIEQQATHWDLKIGNKGGSTPALLGGEHDGIWLR